MTWSAAYVKCLICDHKWTAVFPEGTEKLECPNCSTFSQVEFLPLNTLKSKCCKSHVEQVYIADFGIGYKCFGCDNQPCEIIAMRT